MEKKQAATILPMPELSTICFKRRFSYPKTLKWITELTDSLLQTYIRKGTIDFSKSDTKRDSCRLYYIHLGSIEKAYMEVTNCAKTISLVTFVQP